MRNTFKIASSLGAAALLLSGAAMAAPPTPFGNWTVSVSGTGVVSDITDNSGASNPCGSGAVTGAGFQQCELTIGGQRYIRTRIADATFRSEDFIKIGANNSNTAGNGLASTSTINDGAGFQTSADIMTGWAVASPGTATSNRSEATLGLTLAIAESSSGAFDAFNATFGVKAVTDSAGLNKISELSVGQTVGLGSSTDKQRFELRNVGSTQVLWAGQSVTAAGDFSITTSKNVDTGAAIGSVTNLGGTAVDATVWTSAFGTAPTF